MFRPCLSFCRLAVVLAFFALAVPAAAQSSATLTLTDGTRLHGKFIRLQERRLVLEVDGSARTFDADQIVTLDFDGSAAQTPSRAAGSPATLDRSISTDQARGHPPQVDFLHAEKLSLL